MKSVKMSDLVKQLNLELLIKSSDYESKLITNKEVNRPGLQLAGYLDDFPYKRLQVVGKAEYAYAMQLEPDVMTERFKAIFSYPIPALIFSYDVEISDHVLDFAKYYNKTVLRTEMSTPKLVSEIQELLDELLAEEVTMHADLLEVFGMGVMITGDSSVGKSETALDLITRGHRLVADDVVDVIKVNTGLRGSCPKNIRHFIEIRGIGIIDIQRLYGVGAVMTSSEINMVIHLEQWDDNKEYDRLGLDEEFTEILGVKLPIVNIPVKPGRNIAMIVEIAAKNTRQRALGYNAAEELNKRLIADMVKNN